MKLKITQIVDKPYQGKNSKTGDPLYITSFLGQDEQGQAKIYKTFSKTVFEQADKMVGQELEGEVTEKEYQGQVQYNFTPNTDRFKGDRKFGRSPEERSEIIRQNSVTNALKFFEMTPASKEVTVKGVLEVADQFFDYCKGSEAVVKKEEPNQTACADCGVEITEAAAKMTKTKFDRPLCYDCSVKAV